MPPPLGGRHNSNVTDNVYVTAIVAEPLPSECQMITKPPTKPNDMSCDSVYIHCRHCMFYFKWMREVRERLEYSTDGGWRWRLHAA